ncbi:PHP domain-containing protein [Methylogaea oryzae]|uniref:PHP domain-containing protein n=1 Tax=Methylogaea oryzae TaxID=1295382 RepID=UPI0006D29F36|nr:PHP domain-containing protein [Methylogaea oryzae]
MQASYDLHCHSTASDGALSPTEVVQRAAQKGVTTLALTDHDCVNGLQEAAAAAQTLGISLIPGIELSTTWNRQCVHVVGLRIDPDNAPLRQGMAQLTEIRAGRAREIGRRLAKIGFAEAYDTAIALAGKSMITRPHFARALVQQGRAVDEKAAFERFLARGKHGYVTTEWAPLAEAVGWVRQAGGIAVLAHPFRYNLTGTKMRELVEAFIAAGGEAMEVVCGNSNRDEIRHAAELATRHGLLASAGSDFHSPDIHWLELGRLQELPAGLTPVWQRWQ